jgi:uncharacterized membrane protein
MFLRDLVDRLRQSLWFIPSVGAIFAGLLALGMVGLSSLLDESGTRLPLVFEAGADGARAMLQAIAGSVITVAGVVFSITIVALQLTSTQFSPRVLRNFLRDRPTQSVLAVFIGTFVYALLVLRTIHTATAEGPYFVPNVAVTGALVLAFASLAMLIFYIHHISVRIQAGSILAAVTAETFETLERMGRDAREPVESVREGDRSSSPDAPPAQLAADRLGIERPQRVRARSSGYVRLLQLKGMLEVATEHDLRVRCRAAPGDWVQAGATLHEVASTEELDDELITRLVGKVSLGTQRTMQQDVGFGLQQLVDIAVKALSPGINDPTTAIQSLDRITQVLAAIGERPDPPNILRDEDGVPRVEVRLPTYADLVREAFRQVRPYASDAPVVLRHMARSLRTLESALPAHRRAALVDEAQLLARCAQGLTVPEDRDDVVGALGPLAA